MRRTVNPIAEPSLKKRNLAAIELLQQPCACDVEIGTINDNVDILLEMAWNLTFIDD
jgi:hypothetical protein